MQIEYFRIGIKILKLVMIVCFKKEIIAIIKQFKFNFKKRVKFSTQELILFLTKMESFLMLFPKEIFLISKVKGIVLLYLH